MRRSAWSVALVLALIDLSACGSDSGASGDPTRDGGGDDAPLDATWNGGIGLLLSQKCGSCHQEGGIAPFAMTHRFATQAAQSIKVETSARRMPPMPVNGDGSCQEYSNARWLTDAQIKAIAEWADAGAPTGDDTPENFAFPTLPSLGEADIELQTPVYSPAGVAGNEEDDYRCFLVDPGIDEDVLMTGYEVIPGNEALVHHVIVYRVNNAEAEALDNASAREGYPCFGDGGPGSEPVVLWAPGGGVIDLPAGTALRIASGKKLAVQVHYHLVPGESQDPGTKVRIKAIDTTQDVDEAVLIPLLDSSFVLPPGQERVVTEPSMSARMDEGVIRTETGGYVIHLSMPHMHGLGRALTVTASQGGQEQCLSHVDRWDFNWQGAWQYASPIAFPLLGGAVELSISCEYDTRSRNEAVRWGDGTNDEMCLNYFYVTIPSR